MLAIVCFTSCTKPLAKETNITKESGRTKMLEEKEDEPPSEYQAITDEIGAYFRNRNFVAIEKRAETVRRKKERLSGGYWKIKALYDVVVWPGKLKKPADEDWDQLFDKLKDWKE